MARTLLGGAWCDLESYNLQRPTRRVVDCVVAKKAMKKKGAPCGKKYHVLAGSNLLLQIHITSTQKEPHGQLAAISHATNRSARPCIG